MTILSRWDNTSSGPVCTSPVYFDRVRCLGRFKSQLSVGVSRLHTYSSVIVDDLREFLRSDRDDENLSKENAGTRPHLRGGDPGIVGHGKDHRV